MWREVLLLILSERRQRLAVGHALGCAGTVPQIG